jgi:pyruvate formate lyase activating enzyme
MNKERAVIFDIQRFSIHDGPGIRTTIFFKGCPLTCQWCQNPESLASDPEIAFYIEYCTGCFSCKSVCPRNAIVELEEKRIERAMCDRCGECISACMSSALKWVGKEWPVSDLLTEVLKDKDFFLDSGGGITLSGGEPTLSIPFLKLFLPLVKNENIHVTLETCGMFNWRQIKKLLPYLDLVYYDLKCMDPKIHKRHTGKNNRTILENFRHMSKVQDNLQARMPVIPSINDTGTNISETVKFLKENRHKSIHLLKYHRMGEGKLARIDAGQRRLSIRADADDHLLAVKESFARSGIDAVVYD